MRIPERRLRKALFLFANFINTRINIAWNGTVTHLVMRMYPVAVKIRSTLKDCCN